MGSKATPHEERLCDSDLTLTVGITRLAWLSISFVAEKKRAAPMGVMNVWSSTILLMIAFILQTFDALVLK